MRRTALNLLLLFGLACSKRSGDKGPAKHYHLTGKVVSVNTKDQTASIDAAAIPNYMEAMTMSYPIATKAEFDGLKPGDEIEATVNAYDSGDYDISNIKKKPAH